MKVIFAYPPLLEQKGHALVTQNRQFQWTQSPHVHIYPCIPASAVTLLNHEGHKAELWDGIIDGWTYDNFVKKFERKNPDVFVIETKTPIVKQHWKMINDLKERSPDTNFVLLGDHVSALPLESFEKCKVDAVIKGGDYDFMLSKYVKALEGKGEMPNGVVYVKGDSLKDTGAPVFEDNLDELPFVDRKLTHFEKYYEAWAIHKPFAYMLAGRDCPYKCAFCSWSWNLFPGMRYRSVDNYIEELQILVDKYKVKEMFDDTGTFTVNRKWVDEFCLKMNETELSEKLMWSCNTRVDHMQGDLPSKLRNAGCRLVKLGFESANNDTLKKINKGITVSQIESGVTNAKAAGLSVLLTIMVGYPWETKQDAQNTVDLAKKLLPGGIGDVLQASIVVPYPGTKLYKDCLENDWLKVKPGEWERFDMTEPVMKTEMSDEEVKKMCDAIWKVYTQPSYILNTLLSIRRPEHVGLLMRGVTSALGHVTDFKR